MLGKAKVFGHPIHPVLIVFPLGLLATSLAFEIARLATGNLYWAEIAYWMIFAGLLGGAAAGVFGAIDFLAIPRETRAKRIGALHGVGNVIVLVLFLLGCLLRNRDLAATFPIALSVAGVGLALITGWLGGELVDRLGVGVHDDANVNAPSSLAPKR